MALFVELSKPNQIELVEAAIRKAGSERKLESETGISDAAIHEYKTGRFRMPYGRFKLLVSFLARKESEFEFKLADSTIYRIKGGKAVYKKYLQQDRFGAIHAKMRAASSERMKQWHKKMKCEQSEEYHKLQYERFKKIAKYKFQTKKGEFVRNSLECDVANRLFDSGFDYQYEPYVKGACSPYFPDFKIGNLLIECTAWKGFQKAPALSKKIADLEKAGYEVKVIVPNRLRSFYKLVEKSIISIEELTEICPGSSDRGKLGKPISFGATGRAPDC